MPICEAEILSWVDQHPQLLPWLSQDLCLHSPHKNHARQKNSRTLFTRVVVQSLATLKWANSREELTQEWEKALTLKDSENLCTDFFFLMACEHHWYEQETSVSRDMMPCACSKVSLHVTAGAWLWQCEHLLSYTSGKANLHWLANQLLQDNIDNYLSERYKELGAKPCAPQVDRHRKKGTLVGNSYVQSKVNSKELKYQFR